MNENSEFIVNEIKEISKIDITEVMEIGILSEKQAKRWLVKSKYYALRKTGRTFTDIKLELSVDYDISVSAIEKMVYKK